ncbi:glycosyltransferase family 4 protein [Streptomyces beijiangensis]|uniref:Glycosyltransferase family 4 protein n=1 Tax=Streptomyces beijiangensis TaxID=163361 RepID=A0A939F675_9ACTN|nr:glycosyltransferase family 4 protein [Streptomyces beijiangensis]MBO0511752.1 glycosyltransferase family 4 protein [Streptomyces beijiangensis]
MNTARVTVVQPYLTPYRLPFFARLTEELARRDIELTVAHGRPVGSSARRGDGLSPAGTVLLRQRDWQIAGRRLLWRDLREVVRSSDAVVLSQELRHLDTYPLLARRRVKVALWGHGRTCPVRHGAVLRHAKAALTRRADWFFAYTDEGREYAERSGLSPRCITVLNNAIDTASLAAAREKVGDTELREFRERYGLTAGRTGLYIGALDTPKRVPFLLDAAEELARRIPGFRLLVAGDGAERALVEGAGPAVVYTGTASDRDKALLGAAADIMLTPGAVGLCAVDSFALRVPVATTRWPFHGPEFSYLEHGRNALITTDDPDAYSDAVMQLLCSPRRLASMRRSCRVDAQRYTVEGMAAAFAHGTERMIHGA